MVGVSPVRSFSARSMRCSISRIDDRYSSSFRLSAGPSVADQTLNAAGIDVPDSRIIPNSDSDALGARVRALIRAQLNTLTADGMATAKLRNENIIAAYTEIPATNKWCAQTRKPKTAMAMLENATKL